jgi:hypothetical protein
MAIPPGSLQRLYDFSDPACYSSGFVNNLAQIAYRFPPSAVNATFAGSGTSKYFSFNGTNQYIANQALSSIGGAYSALTIIVWFQTTNTNNGALVNWGRTTTYVPGIMVNDANFVQSNGVSTGSFQPSVGNVTTTTPVDINLWQMVAFTADGTNSRIYLNGVLQSTDAQDGGQWPNQGGSAIGARIVSQTNIGAPYFAGNIAYIAQYNAALSGIDILAEYNRLSPRFPNPILITTPPRSFAQGFNG